MSQTESCNGAPVGPRYLGNQYYGDRNRIPTNYGLVRINSEMLWRFWNGAKQEIVGGHFEADCPHCYENHTIKGTDEDARAELVDAVLDCCDEVRWLPPSDYLDPCPVCDHSHRESHECTSPVYREPFPDKEAPAECTDCDWTIDRLADTPTHDGCCPECGSAAVLVGDARAGEA